MLLLETDKTFTPVNSDVRVEAAGVRVGKTPSETARLMRDIVG